jgi:uncharacterized membrane protein (DUF4010 family)
VLGGLISSTATTVSVARRSQAAPAQAPVAGFVILIASAVVFLRVALLLAATETRLFNAAILPCVAIFVVLAGSGIASLRGAKPEALLLPEQANPTELKPAVLFGLLYAVVLLGGAAANDYFGSGGLYAVAILSGLADMDAITLSISHLVSGGEVAPRTGVRLILVAAVSNLGFKAAVIGVLGDRGTLRRVSVGFRLAAALIVILLAAW